MGIEFLEKLDAAILDGHFQKIADWVHNRYNRSCFWLAKLTEGINLGIITFASLFVLGEGIDFWLPLFGLFLLGVRKIKNIGSLRLQDENLHRSPSALKLNPRRRFYWDGFWRVAIIFICLAIASPIAVVLILIMTTSIEGVIVALLGALALVALFYIMIASEYLAACTPKPPRLKYVRNTLAPQPSPTG